MKLNFRKIASVLTSAVMLSSTIGLAAAANYPAPFVKGGSADVAIVYGTTAASADLVAVADITSNLQAELASQTAVSGSTTTTASISGGDYVKLAKPSDNVNLGNALASVFGSRVDKDDLPELLAEGVYSNDENSEYDYEQSLTLGTLTLEHFAQSDYKDKEPTLGFNIVDATNVLTYTLDFTTDAESDVTSGDLVDFESTDITILGKSYYILDAKNGSTSGAAGTTFGKFTLLDTANTVSVSEGETQTVSVGETQHEVSVDSVSGTASSPKVKLSIDGQITNSLAEGETSKLKDGSYIGIKTISMRDIAGSVAKIEFSIGAGKLEIENGKDIELNDDTVTGVSANFTRASASAASTKEKLDKLNIYWAVDDRTFITPTTELTMPGFGAVKLSMGKFFTPAKEVIVIENDGSDSIRLEVPLKEGTAKFNILYANSSGEFTGIGKSSTEKLATTNTSALTYTATSGNDKWFVLSYATTSESESYLLSASVTESDNKNRTTIKNEVTGTNVCEDKTAGDTCNIGSASMTITQVNKSGSTKTAIFTAGTSSNFNTLYTKTGLKLNLPFVADNASVSAGAVNFTGVNTATTGHDFNTVFLNFTEENKDDDVASGSAFSLVVNDNSDGKLEISDMRTGSSEFELVDTDDKYVSHVSSDLATLVTLDTNPDQDTVEIEYHGSESYAEVFLTAVGATVSSDDAVTTTSSGTVKKLGSVSVSDAEAASVSTKNLIVVGGSCVNSVAADLLGGALCGANFEAKTTAGAGSFLIQTFSRSGGKVATLVAGYNAADTTNAAKYLTTQSVDTAAGKTYVGTSATSAKLMTATTTSTTTTTTTTSTNVTNVTA